MAAVESYYTHPHVQAQIFPDYESALKDGLQGLNGLGVAEDVQQLLVVLEQRNKEIEKKLASFRRVLLVATLLGVGGTLIGISLYLRKS